ncbi:hypothetical protein LCGC14_2075850, partial [marine sediment metagenome]
MTTVYGTGFEMASTGIIAAADVLDSSRIFMDTVTFKTGAFALAVEQPAPITTGVNWVRFAYSGAVSEAWSTVWFAKRGSAKETRIEFLLSDGNTVGFRASAGTRIWDAYRGETKIANGTTTIPDTFQLFEIHVLVADSGGKLDLSINGVVEHALTTDTKPGSSSIIDHLRFYLTGTSVGDEFNIDDLTLSESAAPGDIRYISKVPDGDSAVTWTRSAGGTNFSLVDEIPPSDADYVETATNTNQDLYTLADYSLSNTIKHIVQWIRGFSTPSGGEFKMQVKSGATTSEETTSGLAAAVEYVSRILETDPDTLLAWNTTGFNAALVGQEAVVTTETVRVTQHIIEIGFDQNSSSLLRPLGLDVDLESGSRAWVTAWDSGTLSLKRLPATLASSTAFSFGAATEAQIDARTFFLSPYTPAFFGTANLNDIIYVYGRWNDGAVTHIEKSTDGGATFVDIGDSATWGADWVGGFFADDASTLFAIINGASPALYRSLNGGTSWSNLSVTPFDVDPQAVSKHADGRILIANRVAAAQMVAFA